jgi:hypothetical protein
MFQTAEVAKDSKLKLWIQLGDVGIAYKQADV